MNEPLDYLSLQRMLDRVKAMPKGKEKTELTARIEAKAYGYRISRMEALEIDIKAEMVTIANKLNVKLTDSLLKTASKAYILRREENAKQLIDSGNMSVGVKFGGINTHLAESLVKENWSGKHFSKRIWNNAHKLEQELNSTLKECVIAGRGSYRTAELMRDRLAVGMNDAIRLVRTETTHITNAADIEGYKADKIEEYKYLAALDRRTSKVCQGLNGKIFNVADAQAGVNLPPMHPNCRSTTVAVIEEIEITKKQTGAKDETIITGAKKTVGWEKRHAERYYEEVRNRKPYVDAEKISKHTDFTVEQVEEIRRHVFINEHMLDGKMQRFAVDFDQSQTWQRLCEGKNIKEVDTLFLKHEYHELTLMREKGYNYNDAHDLTNEIYDWNTENEKIKKEGR